MCRPQGARRAAQGHTVPGAVWHLYEAAGSSVGRGLVLPGGVQLDPLLLLLLLLAKP